MPTLKALNHAKVLENVDFDFVRGPQDVGKLRSRLKAIEETEGAVAIDTETTGLCPRTNQVRLIQIAVDETALIVDLDGWRKDGERQVDWSRTGLWQLAELLRGGRSKIFQNAAFDINFLRGEGIVVGGDIFDTMIASKLINNGYAHKNDLGSIVERVLRANLPKELQKSDWGGEITSEMLQYAARDAVCLTLLAPELADRLRGSRIRKNFTLWDLFIIEMEVLRPIAYMQWHGFGFDREAALQLQEELEQASEDLRVPFLETLDKQIKLRHPDDPAIWLPRDPDGSFNCREKDSGSVRLGTKVYKGFNPRSTQQMATRFAQAGVILPPDEKGNPTLDQNLLAFVKNEYSLVKMYLDWKESATRISDIQKLLKNIGPDERIHCSYRQVGTETGRLSAAEPNLQQVPRLASFRRLFRAREGYKLVVGDFSQIELRVAAELSGEPRMIEAYLAGRDLHTETAALMAGVDIENVTKDQRQSAKICNFGLLFGAGPATLRKQSIAQYDVDIDMKEAKRLVDGFRNAYPRLYEWQTEQGNMTTQAVLTKLGRRRFLVGYNDKYTTRINTQVQGTAGDIAKLAIRRLWREICASPMGEARLIAMVHDELVLEVREEEVTKWEGVLKASMEAAGKEVCELVPVVAEVSSGETWADAK